MFGAKWETSKAGGKAESLAAMGNVIGRASLLTTPLPAGSIVSHVPKFARSRLHGPGLGCERPVYHFIAMMRRHPRSTMPGIPATRFEVESFRMQFSSR